MRIHVLVLPFILTSFICAAGLETNNIKVAEKFQDTFLIKKQNALTASYEVGFYSRSFSYFRVAGKDTIDLVITATEHQKDSSLHLNFFHKKSIAFNKILYFLNESIPQIKSDFNIDKLTSLDFRSPAYYLDLTKELSRSYEQNFGRKNISYKKLNDFLLSSSLNKALDKVLKAFNKEVKRYNIEKFHIMDKKNTRTELYFTTSELNEYPVFAIDGMGLYVQIKDR